MSHLRLFVWEGELASWQRVSNRATSTAWVGELDLQLRSQLQDAQKRRMIPKLTQPRKRKKRTISLPALENPAKSPNEITQPEKTEDMFDDEWFFYEVV